MMVILISHDIGWIFVGEVSTLALKAKTAGMAVLLQSFSGILFSYTVPIMLSPQQAGWGVRIGYFFGGLTFFYLIMVYFSMPEVCVFSESASVSRR